MSCDPKTVSVSGERGSEGAGERRRRSVPMPRGQPLPIPVPRGMRHQGGNRESTLYGIQGQRRVGEVQGAGGSLLLRGTGAQSPRKPSDEEQGAGMQSPEHPRGAGARGDPQEHSAILCAPASPYSGTGRHGRGREGREDVYPHTQETDIY